LYWLPEAGVVGAVERTVEAREAAVDTAGDKASSPEKYLPRATGVSVRRSPTPGRGRAVACA